MTGVNVRAMTVNVNSPRDRGTAFAWFNLTDDLGKGFGPVLSAWLIAKMGREAAFRIGFWFWLPWRCLVRRVRMDPGGGRSSRQKGSGRRRGRGGRDHIAVDWRGRG